jgi:galactokinase
MTGETERLSQVERSFGAQFGHAPSGLARAPGRVNLIGEHVDYNEGWVLPAAIERSVLLAFEPIADPWIELTALDIGESVRLPLGEAAGELQSARAHMPRWARYPAGVAWALGQSHLTVRGLRGVFTSTVPIGARLSSSAAVEAAFALAWQAGSEWSASRMDLASMSEGGKQYVGVHCGLMDQFACAPRTAGRCNAARLPNFGMGGVPIRLRQWSRLPPAVSAASSAPRPTTCAAPSAMKPCAGVKPGCPASAPCGM